MELLFFLQDISRKEENITEKAQIVTFHKCKKLVAQNDNFKEDNTMKSYREFTREEFKKIADEGFEEQIEGLKRDRARLDKIMRCQPTKESKNAFIKVLKLYDGFESYLEELGEEDINPDDKWLFCDIMNVILLRIEEYFDERTDKNKLLEMMFW